VYVEGTSTASPTATSSEAETAIAPFRETILNREISDRARTLRQRENCDSASSVDDYSISENGERRSGRCEIGSNRW
jgi:hypothetical protein